MITDKNRIEREQLKANTLSRVILRLDFTRVLDIRNFIEKVQKDLAPKNFKYKEDLLGEIEFSFNDPDPAANEVILKKSINKEVVYRFCKESTKTTISISRFFISCEILCNTKYCFTEYIELFCLLVGQLQTQFEFLEIVRVGLRKVNIVLCKDLDNVFECFEPTYYSTYSTSIRDASFLKKNNTDCFIKDGIGFNLIRILEAGIATQTDKTTNITTEFPVVQVVLDIDGYLKDELLPDKPFKEGSLKETIEKINYCIFNMFREHITLTFLNDLISGKKDRVVGGVTLNDQICQSNGETPKE